MFKYLHIYIYICICIIGKIDVLDELSQESSDCIGSPSFSPTNNYGLVYTGTTVSTLSYPYWSFLPTKHILNTYIKNVYTQHGRQNQRG